MTKADVTMERIQTLAAAFFEGRTDVEPQLDAPDFDAAYAAVAGDVADMFGEQAALDFDVHLKAHAMERHHRGATTRGDEIVIQASLFAIPFTGPADSIDALFRDADLIRGIGTSLIRRGVAHPHSEIALVAVPVTALGAARIGPGATLRLCEDLLEAVIDSLFPDAEGPAAPGGTAIVAAAFGGEARPTSTHGDASMTVASRLMVGMRVLTHAVDQSPRDYFTEYLGDAEIAGDDDRFDPHALWIEATRRDLADLGIDVMLPTTFTEAASIGAAATAHAYLDMIAVETGWPMEGRCERVHVHEDDRISTLCFVRNGTVYGPIRTPMEAIVYDHERYVEVLDRALTETGSTIRHDDVATMPGAVTGLASSCDGIPAPINDNLRRDVRAR